LPCLALPLLPNASRFIPSFLSSPYQAYVDDNLEDLWAIVIAFGVTICLTLAGVVMFYFYASRKTVALATARWQCNQLEYTICSLMDCLLMVDLDGIVMFANPSFLEASGFVEKDVVGVLITDLVPQLFVTDLPSAEHPEPRHLNTPNTSVLCADGRSFHASISISITPTDVIVLLITNETERDQTMNLLRQADAAAITAFRHKSQFFSFLCHELRNPLHAIMSLTELMLDSAGDDNDLNKHIEGIASAGRMMRRITEDSLDLERIEDGGTRLELVPTVLADEVRNIVRGFAVRGGNSAVRCVIELDVGIDEEMAKRPVYADVSRMTQVLTSILSNSLNFTPPDGSVVLTMRHSALGDTPFDIKAQVEYAALIGDDIYEASAAEHFTVFEFELESTSGAVSNQLGDIAEAASYFKINEPRVKSGSELSLVVAKQITELMKGTLNVKKLKRGTFITLRFVLPYCIGTDTAAAQRVADVFTFPPLRIIFADDVKINRKMMQHSLSKLLRATGHTLTLVEDGQQLVDKCSSGNEYDIVITDVNMPVLDGFQATQQLRASGCALPIIAVTGNATNADRGK
jgi:PAS domain S-box-containing protein